MEFIIESAHGQSPETRRRVRSLVMKEYRHRQRTTYKTPPKVTLEESWIQFNPVQESFGTMQVISNSPPKSRSRTGPRHGSVKKLKKQTAPGERVLRTPTKSAVSSVVILRNPNVWPSRFSSDSGFELDQAIALAISGHQRMIPTPLTSDQAFTAMNCLAKTRRVFSDSSFHSFSEITSAYNHGLIRLHLSAVCLLAIGQTIHTNTPYAGGGLYDIFKGDILRNVATNLSNLKPTSAKLTLTALGYLTLFELSCDSLEAGIHLKGIKTVLETHRGVLSDVCGRGVKKLLEMIDLLSAVMTGAEPLYTTSLLQDKFEVSPPVEQALPPCSSECIVWQLRRSQTEKDPFQRFRCDSSFSGLALTTLGREPGCFEESNCATHGKPQHAMINLWSNALAAVASQPKLPNEIVEACLLASDLLKSDHTIQSTPSSDLCDLLCSLDEFMWNKHAGAHIRVLLIAITNCDNQSQRAQLATQVLRCVSRLRRNDWIVMKGVIIEFINMQNTPN